MKIQTKKARSAGTEKKIKEAAEKLFTRNGYAAVRTRDIAAEAGINLALLNYYFRSKEKLFEIIMLENMQKFVKGIAVVVNNESTTVEQKLEDLVSLYIDMLTKQPDLPLFLINQVSNDPEGFVKKMDIGPLLNSSYLVKQLQKQAKGKKRLRPPFNPVHIVINAGVLTVAPFIMSPVIRALTGISQQQFNQLMIERKMLIPRWIKMMAGDTFSV